MHAPTLRLPRALVVGAACRDLDPAAPTRTGWRLGGAVAYAALTLARLGVETAAVIGADFEAARAPELDLLRLSGVDVAVVPLAQGALFRNVETPSGRTQWAFSASDPLPPEAVPDAWRAAAAWMLAPIAGELDDAWAPIIPDGALVALGWQGLLRRLVPGRPVEKLRPGPSALVARAALIGVGADDLAPDVDVAGLGRFVAPGAAAVLTRGAAGGLVFEARAGALRPARGYPAVPATPRDPTGAGDVLLAALLAAKLGAGPGPAQERPADPAASNLPRPEHLRFAATVAALAVEGIGLDGVPEASAVRRRLRAQLAAAPEPA